MTACHSDENLRQNFKLVHLWLLNCLNFNSYTKLENLLEAICSFFIYKTSLMSFLTLHFICRYRLVKSLVVLLLGEDKYHLSQVTNVQYENLLNELSQNTLVNVKGGMQVVYTRLLFW